MAGRFFTDGKGQHWAVWEVARHAADRRAAVASTAPAESDRRRPGPPGRVLAKELQGGWLCFESAGQKRRLAPIPAGWIDLPSPALGALLAAAVPVGSRPSR